MNKKQSGGAKLSKREQLRAERQKRNLTWNLIIFGGLGLAVIAVAAYYIANGRPGPLPGEQVIADEGQGHVEQGTALSYQHYPPSSGTHYFSPAPWGVASTPLPEGNFVHNLEHGGVVFLYHCEPDCPELVQQFEDLVAKAPPAFPFSSVKMLVTAYDATKMPSPIVALAWRHQLNLNGFDEALMLRWYKRFVNLGPEGNAQP